MESVINNKDRQIHQILCVSQNHDETVNIVKKSNRPDLLKVVKIVDRSQISTEFGDVSHQSIAVNCSKKSILSSDDLFSRKDVGNILIFDQLSDPQNIGAIIRSAAAFGIKDIVAPSNSFPGETASMVKASSGNFENIRIYSVNNITNILVKAKKIGYWCVGLAGESKNTIDKIQEFEKTVLVIGSEGAGIRPLIKKNCDLLLKIPMASGVESLNASNAASIALYELYKGVKS